MYSMYIYLPELFSYVTFTILQSSYTDSMNQVIFDQTLVYLHK